MSYSLNQLYKAVGISKQAVDQAQKRQMIWQVQMEELLIQVDVLRADHPGCGLEKMYYSLRPSFIGRDRFIDLLMDLGYGVQSVKNFIKTTQSVSSKYKNLIEGLLIGDINQVVQTDITYFRIKDDFFYIIFIIDVYSKRIVAHQVSDHLRAEANLKALQQLVKLRGEEALKNLIHHSDRGSQYIANKYTALLDQLNCHISMGDKAQGNAYAERVNGIIKNEYLIYWDIQNLKQLKKMVKRAVNHYNFQRPHNHLVNRLSPVSFEKSLKEKDNLKQHFELIYAKQNCLKRSKLNTLSMNDFYANSYGCPVNYSLFFN